MDSSPGVTPFCFSCARVMRAQQVAQLGAGHLLLELRALQAGGEEPVLVEQHVFVERHVGDANGASRRAARRRRRRSALRGPGRRCGVQAAVAVVIADRVRGAQIGHPAGLEQRDQPRLMLARHRHRTGDRQRQRAARADGPSRMRVNPPQKRPAERRQAVPEHLVESLAFVDTANVDARAAPRPARRRGRRRRHRRGAGAGATIQAGLLGAHRLLL